RLDEHRHVGELEAHALAAEDRATEGLALTGVSRGVLECRPRDADRAGRDLGARGLEEVERDLEALTLVPEPAMGGHAGRVQEHGSCPRCAQAELALDPAGGDAGIVPLDEKRRELTAGL